MGPEAILEGNQSLKAVDQILDPLKPFRIVTHSGKRWISTERKLSIVSG